MGASGKSTGKEMPSGASVVERKIPREIRKNPTVGATLLAVRILMEKGILGSFPSPKLPVVGHCELRVGQFVGADSWPILVD